MEYSSSLLDFENEYRESLDFVHNNPEISDKEFDAQLVDKIRLFNVPSDASIFEMEKVLDSIIKTLPAIKRIFSKPIVHLKDVYELSPIESVKKINSYTLSHASIHSELWSDVNKDGIKPQKLMTLEKAENYVIYENIVFVRVVDAILDFVRRMLVLFNDIMYSCRDLHFNLLDRTHHSLYFLAIGKLHVEYVLAQRERKDRYVACIDKLLYIDKALRAKLSSEVYKKCKKVKKKLSIKRTNVFRSHKDYKQIYGLAKEINIDFEGNINAIIAHQSVYSEEYGAYCMLLSLFALKHFNFSISDSQKISLCNYAADMSFIDWQLNLRHVHINDVCGLKFVFNKDREYAVCILFADRMEISQRTFEEIKTSVMADEYLFANSCRYGEQESIYLSLYDIDSFRRIQQLALRGMIYSDKKRDLCPFCGSPLREKNGKYECDVCRGIFEDRRCPQTGEVYCVSDIRRLRSELERSKSYIESHRFLHDRISEARFHFRNITDVTSEGEFICPKCHKSH